MSMSGPALRVALVLPLALWTALAGRADPPNGAKPARLDAHGDPLPEGAVARLGTVRFRPTGYQGNSALALSPDGKVVALIGQFDDHLVFFDTATGKEVRRVKIPQSSQNFLIYSPDGKYLATVQMGGLQLYDATTGTAVSRFGRSGNSPRSGVWSAVFSADGKVLALCESEGDEGGPKLFATAWDVASRKKLSSIELPHDSEGDAALSADGKVLATWGRRDHRGRGPNPNPNLNRTLQLWDVATGKEVRQIQVDSYSSKKAAFSPDGKELAVLAPDAELTFYEIETGKRLRGLAARSDGSRDGRRGMIRYSPDGKLLLVGRGDDSVQLWETATGKRLRLPEGPDCSLQSVAFLADGKVLAGGNKGQSICLWEVTTGALLSPRGGHTGAVNAVYFLAGGKKVLSVGPDGSRLWDSATGKEVPNELPVAQEEQWVGGVSGFVLSSDGKYMTILSRQSRSVRVHDFATGKELLTVDLPQPWDGNITDAFGGNRVVSLDAVPKGMRMEIRVRVWDLTTKRPVQSLEGGIHTNGSNLALSPDGKYVAVTNGMGIGPGWLFLWQVDGGKEVLKLERVRELVSNLTFSPDSSLLAAVFNDFRDGATIRFWDTRTGTESPILREGGAGLSVFRLAFSPDGRTLARVVANDRTPNEPKYTVQLLELASGKVRTEFGGNQGRIFSLAFSPDGCTLATGGADTTVLLWDATGRATLAARDRLTPEELDGLWAELGGDDARQAYRALARLTAAPADAVALVKRQLPPAREKALEARQVEGLIGDLDADEFETRAKAARSLAEAGKQVRPALVQALEANPSPEKRRQLQKLLDALNARGTPPEMIRPTRALELLERLGTPEALQVVEELAKGHAGASLTEDAKAAQKRMDRKR
jgi:WD40 repeat protein